VVYFVGLILRFILLFLYCGLFCQSYTVVYVLLTEPVSMRDHLKNILAERQRRSKQTTIVDVGQDEELKESVRQVLQANIGGVSLHQFPEVYQVSVWCGWLDNGSKWSGGG
jgi:hypothetical protein